MVSSNPRRCAPAARRALPSLPAVNDSPCGRSREPPGRPILWAGWTAPYSSVPAPGCLVHSTGISGGPDAASARAPTVRSRPAPSNSAPDRLFTPALTLCRCLSCAASMGLRRSAAAEAVGEGGGARGGVGGDRPAPAAPLAAGGAAARARCERCTRAPIMAAPVCAWARGRRAACAAPWRRRRVRDRPGGAPGA